MLEAPTVRNAATAGLLALAGVQAARVVWAVAAPIGPLGAAPAALPPPTLTADFAMLSRFDPFNRAPVATAAAGPAADTAGLTLYAVRAAGARGSAIIAGPDGRQQSFAIGDEVAPGVTLAAVEADHVELSAGARRSSLSFPTLPVGAAPPPAVYAVPPPPAPAAAPAPVQPMAAPAPLAQAMPDFLAAAGLQPGDVVTSVSTPADGQGAVVQYQRAGESRTATVRIPTQ